jgi:hypothetical protein
VSGKGHDLEVKKGNSERNTPNKWLERQRRTIGSGQGISTEMRWMETGREKGGKTWRNSERVRDRGLRNVENYFDKKLGSVIQQADRHVSYY